MLAAHRREYERFAAHPVVFDRGFPDVVGFLDLAGLSVPRAVDEACHALRYNGRVWRAPAWWAIYQQDAERIQDFTEAVASDEAVTAAWRRYGYEVSDLPLTPVAERLAVLRAGL
jgi:predicted ATPase